jgi:TonB family protein
MRTLEWISSRDSSSQKILISSAFLALLLEVTLLIGVAGNHSWVSSPVSTQPQETPFIEAQVIELPEEPKIIEEKKAEAAALAPQETTLNKKKGKGAEHSANTLTDIQNQTQAAPEQPPSHGPIAIFSPSPVIPSYLQNRDLEASVIIDFFVNALGESSPRLAGSSGNEELDAIALATAEKWQFRPAEDDRKPIDSKVRLRIVFEVH